MANTALQLTETLKSRFSLPVGFRERPDRPSFPSGVQSVDQLLNGGFPRAAMNEVSGAPSSNRTALVVSTLAQALAAGECGAWIDASGAFDPNSAAEGGIELDRVLWINCRGNAERALKATDLLLHGGGFGVMVLDLSDIPETIVRRIALASWFRLRNAAEETGTALLVMTPLAQARSCSAVCIELSPRKSVWRGRLLRGLSSLASVRKHNSSDSVWFESIL
jgi:hypothetical protein